MSRPDQDLVLRWALGLMNGSAEPLPALEPTRLHRALLYTGLTAPVAQLTDELAIATPQSVRDHLDEQRAAVRWRTQRYLVLAPEILECLARAGVAATPVKGLMMNALGVWPWVGTRPMADIDVLVPVEQRETARTALDAAGLTMIERSAAEDVFLAWGDGSIGRLDGESTGHNGKIEIHPGWAESVHGYELGFPDLLSFARRGQLLGSSAAVLPPEWFVAHVIGHLSASVIRREVRAVNIVDVIHCLRWLDSDRQRSLRGVLATIDPRLVAPALWLVDAYDPAALGRAGLTTRIETLSRRARSQLGAVSGADVLRDPDLRSLFDWRAAWAARPSERVAVARQALVPPTAHLRRADPTASALVLHARRVGRGARRAFGRGAAQPAR